MATPREAVESFAKRIHEDFEKWYDEHEGICRRWYIGLQVLALLLSLATATIAALADEKAFGTWAKYALVILPLAASLVTSLLSQIRFYDLWKLREQGRIQFQDLAFEAERRAAAATDAECTAIHEELQKRVNEIESTQSASFFGLFSSDLVLQLRKP
jgi:hypothetical protein